MDGGCFFIYKKRKEIKIFLDIRHFEKTLIFRSTPDWIDKFKYIFQRFVSCPNKCFQISVVHKLVQTTYSSVIDPSIDRKTYGDVCNREWTENESELGRGSCRVMCARLYRYQEDVEEDEGELESRTVTQPIPDMDTCLHRLHQLRPTNQTRISPLRCTNRAWPFSTLLTSSLSRSSLYPSPSLAPFSLHSLLFRLQLLSNLLPPRFLRGEQSPWTPFSCFSANLASRRVPRLLSNPPQNESWRAFTFYNERTIFYNF